MPPEFEGLLASFLAQAGGDEQRLTSLLLTFLDFHDLYETYRPHVNSDTITRTMGQGSSTEFLAFLKLIGDSNGVGTSDLRAKLIGYIFPEAPAQAVPALLLLLQLTLTSPLPSSPAAEVPGTQLSPHENGQKLETAFKDGIAQLFSQVSLSISIAQLRCLELVPLWEQFTDVDRITTLRQQISTQLHTANEYIQRISTMGRELEDSLALTEVDPFTHQRLLFMRLVIRKINHDLGNILAGSFTRVDILQYLLNRPENRVQYQPNPAGILLDAINQVSTQLQPYVSGPLRQTLFENPAALLIPDTTADLKRVIDRILDQLLTHQNYLPSHITLKRDFNPQVQEIRVSEVSMASILNNLLGNAIRHMNKSGNITIRIYPRVRSSDQKKFVILEVEDEGEGIPPEILPLIFEDGFSRRGADQVAGTGQGLTIVRDAVERHAGHIVALSQVNVGTTFRMAFPLVAETP